ncbi:DNA-binding NarL/FixJ family response regulator [Chitinophaga terrae (ex Kim and Jung 2007)]|jgi:DNA-binding NarL/FixJ family response regulator|uniref:response regulator transcription factor n=1 Tax=Chitinophaga terrae (ex Kim and Jung 2007) TaxID=408074 RepID=UPI002784BC47|nr:response regulator transcription factor [Chitinophaga terrae (ex Kim and Jung 2007)]MDQ0107638.1 DNA-binding NarL/FixJ family response regulator [Chitinophaga terrae (ex Kim and Jung 2007)]
MEKMDAIAIVFDDHLLFADSFSALIERLELFRSVHTLNEERDLINFLIKHSQKPIYLFLDYYLKNKIALPLINEARRLNKRVIVIVMSSVISATAITNILSYNPNGFVSKSLGFDTILECLTTISRGEQYISPAITEIVSKANNNRKIIFTARELEILQYFAQGLSIAHTAEQTHLSKHTIVAHRRNMMAKVKVNSITELLSYAREHELI